MLSFSHRKSHSHPVPYHNCACIAQKSPLASVNGNHLCVLRPQKVLLIVFSGVSLFYGTWVYLHPIAFTKWLAHVN